MSNTIKMNLPESFDFTLIAIITSEPIYRLGWLLNQSLKIDLKEVHKSVKEAPKQFRQYAKYFQKFLDTTNK